MTLENIDIDYNSVGRDFDLEAVIDHQKITLSKGSQITLGGAFPSSFIRYQLLAVENDSVPDVGRLEKEYSIQKLCTTNNFI